MRFGKTFVSITLSLLLATLLLTAKERDWKQGTLFR
jgi:hypothetical protein